MTRKAIEDQQTRRARILAGLERLNRRIDATMTRRWQAHLAAFGIALLSTGLTLLVVAR